jgi:hypothetical protein
MLKIGDSVRLTKDYSMASGLLNRITIKKGTIGHIIEIHKEIKRKPWYIPKFIILDYGVPEFLRVEFEINGNGTVITLACSSEILDIVPVYVEKVF